MEEMKQQQQLIPVERQIRFVAENSQHVFELTITEVSLSYYLSNRILSYDQVLKRDAENSHALSLLQFTCDNDTPSNSSSNLNSDQTTVSLPYDIISVVIKHATKLPILSDVNYAVLKEIVKYLKYYNGRSDIIHDCSTNTYTVKMSFQLKDQLWDEEYLTHLENEKMLKDVVDATSDNVLGITCLHVKVTARLALNEFYTYAYCNLAVNTNSISMNYSSMW